MTCESSMSTLLTGDAIRLFAGEKSGRFWHRMYLQQTRVIVNQQLINKTRNFISSLVASREVYLKSIINFGK